MREWIKALPVSVGLPVVIGAASVKPEDAASNVAAWIEFFGFHNLPHWLTSPNADQHVIAAACFAAAVYSFAVWGPYRQKRIHSGTAVHTWGPWLLILGGPTLGLIWLYLAPQPEPKVIASVSEPTTATAHPISPSGESGPQSLLDLFKTDFEKTMRMNSELTLTAPGDVTDKIAMQIYYDMDAGTYFIGFYVPMSPRTADIVRYLADGYLSPSLQLRQGLEVISRDPADTTSLKFSEFTFSRRIYVYHEADLSIQDIAALDTLYRTKNLILQIRGRQYQTTRWLQKSAIKK